MTKTTRKAFGALPDGTPLMHCAIVVLGLFAVVCSQAEEKLWVGDSGGSWAEAENWSPSGEPAAADTAVFSPSGELTVLMPSAHVTVAGLKFTSGTTLISCSADSSLIKLSAPTGVVYVAQDAYAVLSNKLDAATANAVVLAKRGGGTLTAKLAMGSTGKFSSTEVEAGEFILAATYNNAYIVKNKVIVRNRATLSVADHQGPFNTDVLLTVDKGGIFDSINMPDKQHLIGGIAGEGLISNAKLQLWMKQSPAPCTFSGTTSNATILFNTPRPAGLSEDDWTLTVGSSNAFAGATVTLPNASGSILRFASGIGKFFIGTLKNNGKSAGQVVNLEDSSGEPVSLYLGHLPDDTLNLAGSGNAYVRNSSAVTYLSSNLPGNTGEIGTFNTKMTLGNGTAAGDPDLSRYSGVRVDGSTSTGGTLVFNLASAEPVQTTVGGYGIIEFDTATTLSNVAQTGGRLYLKAPVVFAGGSSVIRASDGLYCYASAGGGNSSLTLENGTRLVGTPVQSDDNNVTVRSETGGVVVNNPQDASALTLREGSFFALRSGSLPRSTVVSDGSVLFIRSQLAHPSTATAESPAVVTVDGGVIRANAVNATQNVTEADDRMRLEAGAGGMTFDCDMQTIPFNAGNHQFLFQRPVYSGVSGGTDGGFTRTGAGIVRFAYPLYVTGGFRNLDGVLVIPKNTDVVGSAAPFGTGDFELGNAYMYFDSDHPASFTLALAPGAGSVFRYSGSAAFRTRESVNRKVQTVVIGPSGATTPSLVRGGRGSAITFYDNAADVTFAESTFVQVNGGMEVDSAGRIKDPVFVKKLQRGGADIAPVNFAGFDTATGRITVFANYTAGLSGGSESVASVTASTTLSSDAAVAALRVSGIANIDASNPDDASVAPLKIASGATLRIGDGGSVASMILSNVAGAAPAAVKGAGALEFNADEGLVMVSRAYQAAYPAILAVKITGSSSLSLVGTADSRREALQLWGANDYTGGTVINALRVYPGNDSCFGTGEVRIGDGELAGGQICFAKEGLKIANAVQAAGWGPQWDDAYNRGAIVFKASAEFSGPVEAYGPLRVSALDAGATGVFSGTLSGDRLQVWVGSGEIVLTGANVYTGGTEIVSSTLSISRPEALGFGEVVLDGGVLKVGFETDAQITNRIVGVGTVRLSGTGVPSFASLESDGGAGFTLDLGKLRRPKVASLSGFSAIATDRADDIVLSVLDGDVAAFSGTVPTNVTLYAGEAPDVHRGIILIFR